MAVAKWAPFVVSLLLYSMVATGFSQAEPAAADPVSFCSMPGSIPAVLIPLSGVTPEQCDLQGRMITDGAVGAEVPAPGFAILAEQLSPVGAQMLEVRVDANGTVTVDMAGPEPVSPPQLVTDEMLPGGRRFDPPVVLPHPCLDDSFNLDRYKERDNFAWNVNTDNRPTNLGAAEVRDAITNGFNDIVNANNNCSRADNVSATHSRGSGTSLNPEITADGHCLDEDTDYVNIVGFGNLPSETLGVTCITSVARSGPNEVVEADVKLNKGDMKWFADAMPIPCFVHYGIESVMAHEVGHIFGLDHVSEEEHPYMTMSTSGSPCSRSEETLGLGDILGLEARY